MSKYLIPEWDAPANVRALCSTRHGATEVIDLVTAMEGVRPVWLNQVHGTALQPLDADSAAGAEADGSFTTSPRIACTVKVADCLPILLCNAQGTWVAALHAGWRGLAGNKGFGVVEHASRAYSATNNIASDLVAWLGPCIGSTAFEVGDDVRIAFTAHQPEAQAYFTPVAGSGGSLHPYKWMADLAGLARLRLQAAGITRISGNDSSRAWCTVSNPERFFSYRREKECGRMAATVWITNAAPIPAR